MYKKEDILLSKLPTLTEGEYPSILEFFLNQEGVEVDQIALEKYSTNTTVEIPIKCVCPNCEKETTILANVKKNIFFCNDCKKGGGVVKAIAYYTKRSMKDVMREIALDKVHPLLRLSEKQVALIGYSAYDIRKLESSSDYQAMDSILKEWQLYENRQLSFSYALYLLASIRKDKAEMIQRLNMLMEYASNVRLRNDFLSKFVEEFIIKMKQDELEKELRNPNMVYEHMQRELMEENGVFISIENVIKLSVFNGEEPIRNEWALQGEQYARQAFNRSIETGDKSLQYVEHHLFEMRDYQRLCKNYQLLQKIQAN